MSTQECFEIFLLFYMRFWFCAVCLLDGSYSRNESLQRKPLYFVPSTCFATDSAAMQCMLCVRFLPPPQSHNQSTDETRKTCESRGTAEPIPSLSLPCVRAGHERARRDSYTKHRAKSECGKRREPEREIRQRQCSGIAGTIRRS